MAGLRVVLDTNVLVSGLAYPGSVPGRIDPDPADLAAYKLGYAKWRKLYPAIKTLE